MDLIKQLIADTPIEEDPEEESCGEEEERHRHRWAHLVTEADLIRTLRDIVTMVENHPGLQPPTEMVVAVENFSKGRLGLQMAYAIIVDENYALICKALQMEQ
ncbi:PAS domain-containing protein [Anopheles sinensis]|uniref:PAS domain-containing protein n=1 Tax=Anopheles sinensis TaxID=74873 RepID=A0A084VA03_ANOSI|nr:PAS domain-containing protein [Anopheles sinensis]